MDHCPLCLEPLYLDPDEPHVTRCVLKYGVYVTYDGVEWMWWPNPTTIERKTEWNPSRR